MRPHALAYPLASHAISDYLQLTKPRLNLLVVFTTGVGYWLGVAGHVDPVILFHAVVGTALVAGGSAVFNQLYEPDVDALMARTRLRAPARRPDHAVACLRVRHGAERARARPVVAGRESPQCPRRVRHPRQLRGLVHADEAALIAGDRRRRHSGCTSAGDWLGRGHQRAAARGLAAVRDRVPLADAALPVARVAATARSTSGRASPCCRWSSPPARARHDRRSCTRRR